MLCVYVFPWIAWYECLVVNVGWVLYYVSDYVVKCTQYSSYGVSIVIVLCIVLSEVYNNNYILCE